MGHKKSAGRMQVGSKILFNAVKRISNDFPILKEARREVLQDLMDSEHATFIINEVISGRIAVKEINTAIPSPFAFGLIVDGYSDVIKIEDKQEFLRRMHQMVLARIELKEGKKVLREKEKEFSYPAFWSESQKKTEDAEEGFREKLKMQVWSLKNVPIYMKEELIKLVEFGNCRRDVLEELKKMKIEIEKEWPAEIKEFVKEKMKE